MDFDSVAAAGRQAPPGMDSADPPAEQAFDPVRLELGKAGEDGRYLIFRKYRCRVRRFFEKKGLSSDDAEELTQETFLRVYRGRTKLDGRAQLEAWLFKIARNLWVNTLRSKGTDKRKGLAISLDDLQSGGEAMDLAHPALMAGEQDGLQRIIGREEIEALRNALLELPEQMRQVVRLRLAFDLKYREIAKVLGISIQTVKTHLHHAKKRLRPHMARHSAPLDAAGREEDPCP